MVAVRVRDEDISRSRVGSRTGEGNGALKEKEIKQNESKRVRKEGEKMVVEGGERTGEKFEQSSCTPSERRKFWEK